MNPALITELKDKHPLVHNITNYVTVNDCANIILAIGGSPIMADDIDEVEDIISICDSLVLNIGTLNQKTIEAMVLAGKKANSLNKPVILDPVGNGASPLRTKTTNRLLEEVNFAVIRGNISEIKVAASGFGKTRGVDAGLGDALNIKAAAKLAKDFAKTTKSVIAITGETDIISDGNTAYGIKNGHPLMSKITGTGCMCSCLVGCFCGITGNFLEAAATAVTIMGLAGESAQAEVEKNRLGTGSLRIKLIDAVSNMNANILERGMKIELL